MNLCLSDFQRNLHRKEELIVGVKDNGCVYGECQSKEEKTSKSIYTSAVGAGLDVFCLRGTLCHTASVSGAAGLLKSIVNPVHYVF